ncbi:type IV pilus modification protein PilV [Ramlibacter humi]|uniref:Type IV pilus modification protein PilV n=1 Tax=Ramlibacter humi TaxID=2530451 RepID=A0A4Z0BLR2_9BURK|nr:type IV pilus modification protein PilV [Ramlibacter humi]TFZ00266.1 type IV pilus modification protein PilV [Ramlibacter humi]
MSRRRSRGFTLIEVLVSILVLSFGILGISGMFAFSVQMPKLSSYRTAAVNIAASHVDKVRANAAGFYEGAYEKPMSYDGTFNAISVPVCTYPACTPLALADMDSAETSSLARKELPAGGMLLSCTPSPCGPASTGHVWVIWQEPQTRFALQSAASDNCPNAVTSAFNNPRPRCVYLPFQP